MTLHQHTETPDASIHVAGADSESSLIVACFGHADGDTAEQHEKRWNIFAKTMFRLGLEPVEDEPHVTIRDDEAGVTWDHYLLQPVIKNEGASWRLPKGVSPW